MKHLAAVCGALIISCFLSAQGFPDAQKQPRFKEQKPNQHKYKKWSHRRHVKRGTVYVMPDSLPFGQAPVCIFTNKKSLLGFA